ncbi:hypothetical protein JN531_002075 [Flagellatimonas centrodinii]|uniref:hypothetical protein n=1 Tax=Flagellatimonas centrodinii TaxID=2806210 RepID=UPI001FF81075|nr:hypothetical protein [Flagellatimonas centrodinii]ULQ47083.1 hypothetical protein JN531_002075 [Flagellatimonas centrodinii]
MFAQALSVTLKVLLFRAGPQDFPFLPQWTRTVCVLGATPVFFVYALALAPTLALIMATATVVGMALATRGILRVRKVEDRFTQTFQTLLCANAVLTALMAIPFAQVAPILLELAADPELATGAMAAPDLPGGPVLLMNLLNVWNFVVSAHIFRHATNSGFGAGLLWAFAVVAVTMTCVLVFGTLVGSLLVGS